MKDLTEQELALFEKFKAIMMQEQNKKAQTKRRPKGTGSIVKLSGNRSKPYVVNVTLGHDEYDGRQIKKCLGTFKTRAEAETALSAYNLHRNGYINNKDYDTIAKTSVPTVVEIWKCVCKEEENSITHRTRLNYNTAYNRLEGIYDHRIDRLALKDIQPIFDAQKRLGAGKGKLEKMKIVLSKIYTYAMKYDYCDKDYSKFLNIEAESSVKVKRTVFTKNEFIRLFEEKTDFSKILLILLYTGMRPAELVKLELENIHIEEHYMVGGVKTKNGIDRVIPIHDAILDYVKELKNGTLVIEGNTHRYRYNVILKNMQESVYSNDHTLYDCRHTFATMCNEYNLNEYLIKKMMGHSCKDLTKDVYTHASIERLVNEVNKLPDYEQLKAALNE